MRSIPQLAVDFVAQHEGLRTAVYKDVAGIPTIGYGHIDGVTMGARCTKAQAQAWLASDLQQAAQKLYAVIKPDIIETCLNDQQWSVLLSFAFNLGANPKWGIWKLINAKQFDQAADQFSRFINADGKKVAGLARRRADEFALWHSGEAVQAVPSTVTRAPGVTPPTPTDAKPLTKQMGFMAKAGGLALGAGGYATQNAPTVKGWADKLSAFTTSPIIQHVVVGLVSLAGGMILFGLVMDAIKHRNTQ